MNEGVSEALIATSGLSKLLARVGFYGSTVQAFSAWAELSLPRAMRPYGIVTDAEGAHITPPEALDLLIEQARTRVSPWQTVLWSAVAAAAGALAIGLVTKRRR